MPPFEIPGSVPGASLVNGITAPFQPASQQPGADPPGWQKRILPSAITSPKGTRIAFSWEDTRREIPLRNVAFEFPGVDDAYVQENGFGPRRYPMRCIFWGDDCDVNATKFEAALLEPGTTTLEHPIYGKVKVKPVGEVVRVDDPKNAGNQVIVEVTFYTTTSIVYPTSSKSPSNEISAALEDYEAAAAGQFAAQSDLTSAVAKANIKAKVNKTLQFIEATVGAVAKARAEVNRPFRDAMRAINFGMDILIGQPLQLAQQMSNLITAPARAALGLQLRMDAYRGLAARIFALPVNTGSPAVAALVESSGRLFGLRLRETNNFLMSDLVVTSSVAGAVRAALETQYTTRNEAVATAESVMQQLEQAVLWRDQHYEGLDQTDTGEAYQALQTAVALLVGYLVETSSSTGSSGANGRPLAERRYVLDRQRTIIDVCAELYGTVDDKLDFLISTNNLSGDEILELPRGRELAYFV